MKPQYRKPSYLVVCAAAALTLSLAGCGDKPAAGPASAKIETAADVAAREAQQAQKKKAEQEKAQAEAAQKVADAKAAADRELARKVKAALAARPNLKHLALDVNSSDGEVTLFGTADSNAQRREAEKVAANVAGVHSVKDALQIVRGS
jgi:osmotically-inducible protein OsmY